LYPITSATVWVAFKSKSRTRYVEFHNQNYKFFKSGLYIFYSQTILTFWIH
jgi:hypothetical protein